MFWGSRSGLWSNIVVCHHPSPLQSVAQLCFWVSFIISFLGMMTFLYKFCAHPVIWLRLSVAKAFTISTAFNLLLYDSGSVGGCDDEAVFTLVRPHVIDRWCAGLVVLTAALFTFTCLSRRRRVASPQVFCHDTRRSPCAIAAKPHRQIGVGHLSTWCMVVISLSFLHRGEAINPGPVNCKSKNSKDRCWSMGTFNPSGLGGKHQVVSSYLNHGDLWAVSETHLTSQGMRSFRQGLKWSDSEFAYCIGGQPVSLRSHSCNTGSWNGVAVLSKFPTRAVPVPWGDQVYQTSRVQLTATLCEDLWITGGVLYGEPPGVQHPMARQNTDTLALDVVSHLCQLSGLRFFGGDLNFEAGGLEVFRVLAEAGFRDIQDVALEKFGQPVSKTCKNSTRKDFFFISRELIPFLEKVTVDNTIWADHAVLQGFFRCAPPQLSRHLWRQPLSVEWPDSFDVTFSEAFHQESDPTQKYKQLWHEVEGAASTTCVSRGKAALNARQCGRGGTLDTQIVRSAFQRSPVKPGRTSDVQPIFAGLSLQHAHWFRQLRRLQSFVRFRKAHPTDTDHSHGVTLWSSILRAKGFEGSFPIWWTRHGGRVFGAPSECPLCPPAWEAATKIYESFLIDVRTLENNLKAKKMQHAKVKRQELAHLVFKDIKRVAPDRVDVLLKSTHGEIVTVDIEANTITVDAKCNIVTGHHIFIAGHKCSPLQVIGKQVWLSSVEGFQAGQQVRQSVFTGQAEDLFKQFGDEWSKRWERHKHVPASQWDQICEFGRHHFLHQPIELPGWNTSMVAKEISKKKPHSATGLDGVSLRDLKSMPSTVLTAHSRVFQHAEEKGEWPKQALVGRVASLAKTAEPDSISGFRPITVMPHCYRLWSSVRSKALLSAMSDRCPSFLFGNKPHCQSSMVWTHLAWSIEESFASQTHLAGIVADIEKAFNHLPREVIFQSAVVMGLPFSVLQAWASAMGGLERRFQIREHLGPSQKSFTGFPEGCAMSVLAMMLMDCIFHKWFEVQFPLCQPVSYVDDLQLLTREAHQIPDMLAELYKFSDLVDLTVDKKKTFTWSTSAYYRTVFRRRSIPVKKHARGLGAQLQFGKLHSTEIIQKRIEECKPLWPRLGQSLSPYKVKVMAIKQAAWSRCLHGIAATSISLDTFVSLRTRAMRSLNAEGAGCNPCVHLGMVEHPSLDPFFWSVVETIRTARECASRETVAELFQEAVSGNSRLPTHGMTSILVSRLQHVGWEITSGVNCHDGLSVFSLFDTSFSEIVMRLSWAWQRCVAAIVAHRSSFDGLAECDPVLTRELLVALPVCEQGLMRKALNGALFTNDSVCYFSSSGSTMCQFCGAVDSRWHRFWECEVFSAFREIDVPGFWDAISSLPKSLLCHGWALRASTWTQWVKCLMCIPRPEVTSTIAPLGDTWVDLFTDGSCLWPTNRAMKIAAWSVIEAAPTGNVCHSQVVWAGQVAGVHQSAHRAELQAVCCAVRYALYWKRKVRIWSDCLSVVDRFAKLVQSPSDLKPNSPHYDLWSEILDVVESLGSDAIRITKVASHQDVSAVPGAFENWAFQHNIVADRAANLQRENSFWELHKRHSIEAQWAREVSYKVFHVILQISKSVVAREEVLASEANTSAQQVEWVEPTMTASAPPWDGFIPAIPLPLEATRRYGHRFVATLVAWFSGAVREFVPGCVTQWLSIHQLYLDFQHQTGELGLVYDRCWKDPEILPGLKLVPKSFKRRSTWFGKVFRSILRSYGVETPWMVTRPASHFIALHTACLALPWPEWRVQAIERWLSVNLPAKKAATRSGCDLVHLPIAKQHAQWPCLERFVGPLGS